MTNPTQPLTAETDAIDVVNLITKKILRGNIFVTSDAFKNYIKDTFEAYAAQQNAELVAENKKLKAWGLEWKRSAEYYAPCVGQVSELKKEIKQLQDRLANKEKTSIETRTVIPHNKVRAFAANGGKPQFTCPLTGRENWLGDKQSPEGEAYFNYLVKRGVTFYEPQPPKEAT